MLRATILCLALLPLVLGLSLETTKPASLPASSLQSAGFSKPRAHLKEFSRDLPKGNIGLRGGAATPPGGRGLWSCFKKSPEKAKKDLKKNVQDAGLNAMQALEGLQWPAEFDFNQVGNVIRANGGLLTLYGAGTIASSFGERQTRQWLNSTINVGVYDPFYDNAQPGPLTVFTRCHGVAVLALGIWEFFAPKFINSDNEQFIGKLFLGTQIPFMLSGLYDAFKEETAGPLQFLSVLIPVISAIGASRAMRTMPDLDEDSD